TVTLSVCFGCPFEGRVDPARVVELAARFRGVEVVVADTIGVATPTRVRRLVEATGARGFHGHNTRSTGYANALAALDAGATLLDASVGGLGGCPFAPRATGNIASEDLVYLLEGEGIETGIDLDALIQVSEWLEGVLGRRPAEADAVHRRALRSRNPSRAHQARRVDDRRERIRRSRSRPAPGGDRQRPLDGDDARRLRERRCLRARGRERRRARPDA